MDEIKAWVFDIDGTLTDGGIYYGNDSLEIKKFNVRDAAAFFVLHELKVLTIVITGRECEATVRRMHELKVDILKQNVKNKLDCLQKLCTTLNLNFSQIAYIGDDLNDYSAMKKCGYVACPADACNEIKELADYISSKNGGNGAVRDVVENFYKKTGLWGSVINKIYIGVGS